MSEIFAVALKEVKTLLRDAGTLMMLFVLPSIFITIMSVALRGAFAADNTGERLPVLFVDESHGSQGEDLAKALEDTGRFRVLRTLDDRPVDLATAERHIRRGIYRLGVHLPTDVEQAVELETTATVRVLVDSTLAKAYALSLQGVVEGWASAAMIEELVDETHDLAQKARSAAAAVDRLKIKISVVGDRAEECVENLQKTEKTIRMLDGKLQSIRTKLKASGLPAGAWPAGLRDGPTRKSDVDKGGSKENASVTDEESANRPAQVTGGGGDADASEGLGADADADADADVDADAEGETATAWDGGPDGDSDADADGDTDGSDDANQRGLRVEQAYMTLMGGPSPTSVQQSVPGWTIFALFWIVQTLAVTMMRERLSGVFRRILVSPIPLWKYIIGVMLPYFGVNIVQAVLMFGIGVFLLPLFGCPTLQITNIGALAIVTVGVSMAALSMGLLMASLSRTLFFAASASAIMILIMAIMGGIMVPRVIMPGFMQELGFLVPHAWALDGYQDVLVRGQSVVDVLDTFGVLMAYAVGFFFLAVIRFRRIAHIR